jgi:hypothetical protein
MSYGMRPFHPLLNPKIPLAHISHASCNIKVLRAVLLWNAAPGGHLHGSQRYSIASTTLGSVPVLPASCQVLSLHCSTIHIILW